MSEFVCLKQRKNFGRNETPIVFPMLPCYNPLYLLQEEIVSSKAALYMKDNCVYAAFSLRRAYIRRNRNVLLKKISNETNQ